MNRFNKEPSRAIPSAANIALAGVALYLFGKNRRLHHEATHDELTGLINRRGLNELLDGNRPPRALLYADSTELKKVNDTISHARGDDAIKETMRVLKDSLRPDDVVARIGGDEFLVLLDPTRRKSQDPLSPEQILNPVIARISEETQALLQLEENADLVATGFNIAVGGAVWEQGMSIEDLRNAAEQEMYAAKALQHG